MDEFQVLIVDDEIYAVAGVESGVPWRDLGVTRVFAAYSMAQAKQVICDHPIDIMICDIEMPKGSGLDLLEWSVDAGEKIVCIFLTSHANFEYVKKALTLGSMDYIIKPILYEQLALSIQKAVEQVKEFRKRQADILYAEYWHGSQFHLAGQILVDIINGSVVASRVQIERHIKRLHMEQWFAVEEYIPVLMTLSAREGQENDWEPSLLEYGLRNMLGELMAEEDGKFTLGKLKPDAYILLTGRDGQNPESYCHEIIETCGPVLGKEIICRIGPPIHLEQLKSQADELIRQERGRPSSESVIYSSKYPDGGMDVRESHFVPNHGAVEKAKRYVGDNLDECLSRSNIAAKVYLSPDHLSHIFKSETGMSLSDYIIDQRIKKAKELLSTTDKMVRDIAIEVGYSNLPYFSKVFRHYMGVTPMAYRKHRN